VAGGARARYTGSMRRAACLAFLAATFLAACGEGGPGQRPVPPDGIVARVGAEEVTLHDLRAYMGEIEASFAAQERAFPDEGTPPYSNLEAQAIERLVERVQDEQAAVELGVSAPQDVVARQVGNIDPSDLEKYGVSAERAGAEIAADLLENEIFKAVVSSVEITDADVRAAYEGNIEAYTRRGPRDALYLWVRDEGLAGELHDRIAAGEDFEALAKQYADPEIESGRRTFQDEPWGEGFQTAVFSLDVGELSEPIKSGVGWSLVEPLSQLDPGEVIPLEQVANDIRLELRTQRNRELMTAWQRDLEARLAPIYAEGYDPAVLHTEIPWEGPSGPQKDPGQCDLPAGTYTYEQLADLGCAGGIPIPGVDGPRCPEHLPGDQFTGGFTSEELDSGWAEFQMDTAGSCVGDPHGTIVEIGMRPPRPGLMDPNG
jgi:parvulin-like peptidyl-prolyl isomerase